MAAAIGQRASAAGAADSFCFCVAADSHCNDGPAKSMEDLGTGADRLMRVFDHIGALPAADRPDFLIIAGDLHLKGFLHVRVGPSGLAVREIITGAPRS
jgi:hypothetical protein